MFHKSKYGGRCTVPSLLKGAGLSWPTGRELMTFCSLKEIYQNLERGEEGTAVKALCMSELFVNNNNNNNDINMSTGKRLAKRSILGTRVVAPGIDGRFYPAVIQSMKTSPATGGGQYDGSVTTTTSYVVRFDNSRKVSEFRESELIGPGFSDVTSVGTLRSGQRIYVTYAGRELEGTVLQHDVRADIVSVSLSVSFFYKHK